MFHNRQPNILFIVSWFKGHKFETNSFKVCKLLLLLEFLATNSWNLFIYWFSQQDLSQNASFVHTLDLWLRKKHLMLTRSWRGLSARVVRITEIRGNESMRHIWEYKDLRSLSRYLGVVKNIMTLWLCIETIQQKSNKNTFNLPTYFPK